MSTPTAPQQHVLNSSGEDTSYHGRLDIHGYHRFQQDHGQSQEYRKSQENQSSVDVAKMQTVHNSMYMDQPGIQQSQMMQQEHQNRGYDVPASNLFPHHQTQSMSLASTVSRSTLLGDNPVHRMSEAMSHSESEPITQKQETLKQTLSSGIKAVAKHFSQENEDASKLGFKPTLAMIKSHEEQILTSILPIHQFQVTKVRSWRTGYLRLLRLYEDRFCTIDPDSHRVTNTWSYECLTEWKASTKEDGVIKLQISGDNLKFKCHNIERHQALSALVESKVLFETSKNSNWPIFHDCVRYTRVGSRVAMSFRVCPHGIQELHSASLQIVQTYAYVDIVAISFTGDDTSGIIFYLRNGSALTKSRLFFIQSGRLHGTGRSDLLTTMRPHYDALGIELKMNTSSTVSGWLEWRLSLGSNEGIVMTWEVTKKSARRYHASVSSDQVSGIVSRKLAVTSKGYLLELEGGQVVSMRSLVDIRTLVRHMDSNELTIEYIRGCRRQYFALNRDGLLVSILDAAMSIAKNKTIDVSNTANVGYNLSHSTQHEESSALQSVTIPMYCLKRVYTVSTAAFSFLSHNTESSTKPGQPICVVDESRMVVEACRELISSIPPNAEGLPQSNNNRYILGSIGALWGISARLLSEDSRKDSRQHWQSENAVIPIFQVLYRLSHTISGFKGTAELSTFQEAIVLLFEIENEFCQYWAFRVLLILMACPLSPHDKETEYVNKRVILSAGAHNLVNSIIKRFLNSTGNDAGRKRPDSDLIIAVTSDLLQSVLCSNHDTTNPEHFNVFVNALGKEYHILLQLLRCETPVVIENCALLLHLISNHIPHIAAAIREAALSSGVLLQHFHSSVFSRMEGQRFLSRYLCSLWLSGARSCDEKRLLKRMIPIGFFSFLKMPLLSLTEEMQLDEIEREILEDINRETTGLCAESSSVKMFSDESSIVTGAAGTNMSRLRARLNMAAKSSVPSQRSNENFRIFFHMLTKDHTLPDLIWNQNTRRDLRISLENEIQAIKREVDARGGLDQMAWNHQQFSVSYPSLEDEVNVGGVYLSLWLQAGDGFIKCWDEPVRLFEILFRKFLCEVDRNSSISIMCIRCLQRLYMFHSGSIGPVEDIQILLENMLSTKSFETQHRILALIATLMGVTNGDADAASIDIPDNAEQLLDIRSIGQLCQFVAWSHTNKSEMGNLLSGAVNVSQNSRESVSDEKISRSTTAVSVVTQPLARCGTNDKSLPAVWFVASTGKIPPPFNLIRGPFCVSELCNLIREGELQPFDLVTASKCGSYNEDEVESHLVEPEIDTGNWRRLEQVWQLRWQLCTDNQSPGIFSPAEVALLALQVLTRLVDVHKALDTRGVPFYPVPIAKRILCGLHRESTKSSFLTLGTSDNFLFIISQALLCNDYVVVASAADLLYKLLEYNPRACSKFYLTGSFFYLCSYTGNNFGALARLLHSTHLNQSFRSGFAAVADESESSLKDRSILGNMIPEGLLNALVKYGFAKFAEIFVGNYDTPEVIWNFEMRAHLVDMINQHLGDFPRRLSQNTNFEYEYCPIPGISFHQLEGEIFCHNYYLRNLCDESRFSNWPISEPVALFKACLEEWERQQKRDTASEDDTRENAQTLLNLKPGDGTKELRREYRKLARKFHPDKNPAGREIFEKIQAAYELLLPFLESEAKLGIPNAFRHSDGKVVDESMPPQRLEGGTRRMNAVQLLLRVQFMVCKRYPNELKKYKYPAYNMLLNCLQIPAPSFDLELNGEAINFSSHSLFMLQRFEFLKTAIDLLLETCIVSSLNAAEFISEGGVVSLANLLNFFLEALLTFKEKGGNGKSESFPLQVLSEKALAEFITKLVQIISIVSSFEKGRNAILNLEDVFQFCINWRLCVDGVRQDASHYAGAIKKYALEGIANLSKSTVFQNNLIGSGVLWPLIRNILNFDPSLDPSLHATVDAGDVHLSQAFQNTIASLSARALGTLCGCLKDPDLQSPPNDQLFAAVSKLLTPPMASMLKNKRTGNLLAKLNANIESPVFIWNAAMREELLAFVISEELNMSMKCRPVTEVLRCVDQFEYSALKGEVTIGGVYLRVFNQLSCNKCTFNEIPNMVTFGRSLLTYIACNIQACKESLGYQQLLSGEVKHIENGDILFDIDTSRFEMALLALLETFNVDGLVDDIIDCDDFQTSSFFSLLQMPLTRSSSAISWDILTKLSSHRAFANLVLRQGSLWQLQRLLYLPCNINLVDNDSDLWQQKGWEILESLTSTPEIALGLVKGSGWIEMLGVVSGYKSFKKSWSSRQGAATNISRLLCDSTLGPLLESKVRLFFPHAFIDILKEEGARSMLRVFDNDCETPELIWDSDMRNELRVALTKFLDERLSNAADWQASTQPFNLPPGYKLQYTRLQNEVYIGGVYLSIFLKEPTYHLRDAATFLKELLESFCQELKLVTNVTGDISASRDLMKSNHNKLELVTNATIFICKTSENLCDKLSEWGYISSALLLMRDVLSARLLGTPLLSIFRLLQIASSRLSNVQMMAISGGHDGTDGLVDLTIRAIRSGNLHVDSSLMLEVMKQVFKTALDDHDVNKLATKVLPTRYGAFGYKAEDVTKLQASAPSPAPGPDPVKKILTTDDPLAMFRNESAIPLSQNIPNAAIPGQSSLNVNQRGRYSHLGQKGYLGSQSQPIGSSELPTVISNSHSTMKGNIGYTNQPTFHERQGHDFIFSQSNTQYQTFAPGPSHLAHGSLRLGNSEFANNPKTQKDISSIISSHGGMREFPQASPLGKTLYRRDEKASLMQIGEQISPSSHSNSQTSISSNQQSEPRIAVSVNAIDNHPSMSSSRTFETNPEPKQYVSTEYSHQISDVMQRHLSNESEIYSNYPRVKESVMQKTFQGAMNENFMFSEGNPTSHTLDPAEGHYFNSKSNDLINDNHYGLPQMTLEVNEGSGIDARSATDPKIVAEERMKLIHEPRSHAARERVALLNAALTFKLPEFLLKEVLENPLLSEVKYPSAAKVHAVELLKVLVNDAAYGMKFQIDLKDDPSWEKYMNQDHSLFMPCIRQTSKYLLSEDNPDHVLRLTRN